MILNCFDLLKRYAFVMLLGFLAATLPALPGSSASSAFDTVGGAVSNLPAPHLLMPADNMEMTDIASYFRWTPLAGCSRYEIQIARDVTFTNIYQTTNTENVRYHEDSYFPRVILPTGAFCWHVRAIINGRDGPWSETFRVTVNADHSLAARLIRPINPERPVFLMRTFGLDPRKQGSQINALFPRNVQGIIIPDDTNLWDASQEAIERAQAYEALGIDFVVWNNRARAPLSLLEYLFQRFHHCIGTAEGEHFWSYGWERGPEGNISEWDYVSRAWMLCAKYGRLYFIGDGEAYTYL